MKFAWPRILALLCLVIAVPLCYAAGRNPCDIISKTEAEAVVGIKLEGPQLSPRGTLCKFLEHGYEESPEHKKLVTIGLFQSDHPGPDDVNMRRQSIIQDQSITPVSSKEIPNFADAAIWVWAGGYFGALYSFKGGTLEVAVKISGIPEPAALAAAKKFAARALGDTARTGYKYNPPGTTITAANYNAPGILSPLYLGTFSQIPDDEMTRNYVLSLVQEFNGTCEKVPEIFAIMDYGAYYEWRANKGIITAGARNDLDRQFQQLTEVLHRVHPHMLSEGHDDADTFIKLHSELTLCFTSSVQHLYNNIAELALERRNLPPDVDDDTRFFQMLRPSAREHYKDGFGIPHPSLAEQQELQKVKRSCMEYSKGDVTGEAEGFCRCQVDAVKEAHITSTDMAQFQTNFTQAVTALSKKYPEYDRRKKECYH